MMRRRQRDLAKINVLDLTPVRRAEWEERGARVIVIRPLPTTRGPRGMLDRLLHEMSAKRLRLDEVGSFAWLQLDGQRTVGQVAELLREQFGDAVEPAEERVGKLVQVLYREELVGYAELDD